MPIQGIDPTGLNHDLECTATGHLITEDTGTNTNPRKYEVDNGFMSIQALTVGPLPLPIWTTLMARPRTAGKNTSVYWVWAYNISGVVRNIWIEDVAGNVFCPPIVVNPLQTVLVGLPTPLKVGNNDVYGRASGNNVYVMIGGIEVTPP